MNTARKILSASFGVAVTAALAACTTAGPSAPPVATAPQQTGIEGTWIDAKGVALSTFAAGNFTTVDAQTGATLSNGSYVSTAENIVQVTGTSTARQNSAIIFIWLLISYYLL
jgi:hypothetical protein